MHQSTVMRLALANGLDESHAPKPETCTRSAALSAFLKLYWAIISAARKRSGLNLSASMEMIPRSRLMPWSLKTTYVFDGEALKLVARFADATVEFDTTSSAGGKWL